MFKDLAVHKDARPPAGMGVASASFGVGGVFASGDAPFVFREVSVIIGVDDGEFALREGYAAEGIAVAEAAVQKQQPEQRAFE